MTKKEKDIKRLIKYIAREDVVLFIGSGLSLKAGAPNVHDIKQKIANEAGDDFANGINIEKESLAKVTEEFVNQNDRNELISILKKLFEFEVKDTSDQQMIRCIPHFRKIYTTNYDTLIEDAYPKNEINLVNTNASFAQQDQDRITIYKIHGDLSTLHTPDSIVITETDYRQYFRGKRFDLLWHQFRIDVVRHHVLFIGYSLEDSNILKIIQEVHKIVGNSINEMFLVAPNLSRQNQEHIKRYVTYIDATADELLPQIINSLKETIYYDYKNKKVTSETYSRFCNINGGFVPLCKEGKEQNTTIQFDSVNGNPFNYELKIKSPTVLDLKNTEAYTSFLPYKKTGIMIPAMSIQPNILEDFSLKVNGFNILDKSNLGSLFVCPKAEDFSCEIIQSSIQFKEKVDGCKYPFDNNIYIELKCTLFLLEIISTKKEDGSLFFKINFKFNKKIENISEALKWTKFLKAVYTTKELSINGLCLNNVNIISGTIDRLDETTLFFEVIEKLEFKYGIHFTQYDNYSHDRFAFALLAWSYLAHKSITYHIPIPTAIQGGIIVTANKNELTEKDIRRLLSQRFQITKYENIGKFCLCGKEFNIPFVRMIFNQVQLQYSKKTGHKTSELTSPILSYCDSIYAYDNSTDGNCAEKEESAINLQNNND